MEYLKKNRKLITDIIGICIFMLAFAVVFFYLFKRCRTEFNGDFTDTILWADATLKSGQYCDSEYWYAYFLPFSGTQLMIPVVALFGLTFKAHVIGMALFAVLFGAALVFFIRSLDFEIGESFALAGLTMIFMCASNITRMIFYGHIIHYSMAVLFMCVAFSLLKRSSFYDPAQKNARFFSGAVFVWCMLCCLNGIATALLFFAPFILSIVAERYFDPEAISLKKDMGLAKYIALFAGGGFAGLIIKTILFGHREYEDTITALLPSDGWVWKQSPFLLEWIKVLTGNNSSIDTPMMSFSGIRMLCMYVIALIVLVVPFIAVINNKKIKNRMLRLLVLYYLMMFAITLITYSVSYALVSTWRLSGLVCTAVIVTMLYSLYMLKNSMYVRWYILLIPMLAAGMLISMLAVKNIPSAIGANRNDSLIKIFRENGLTRGYSTFWNGANAVTVLSDNSIVISPIETFPDGSYRVRHYQSEPEGYMDVPGVDRYFVVVDGQDMEYLADTLKPHAVEEIKYQDDLYIWVFDENIFEDFEPRYFEDETGGE